MKMMSWGKYVGLLVLSVVVTELVSIAQSLVNNNFFQGSSGWPLKFSYSDLLGSGYFDSTNFVIDAVFWFIVLWLIWRFLPKLFKRNQ